METEGRFKVGDRAVCLSPQGGISKGSEYEVRGVETFSGSGLEDLLTVRNDLGATEAYFAWRFKLAAPITPDFTPLHPDPFHAECYALYLMLVEKQAKYGNSIFEPLRCFSKAETTEAIKVRIDDKLSRISRGAGDDEDTILDLIGYLILLRIHQKGQADK